MTTALLLALGIPAAYLVVSTALLLSRHKALPPLRTPPLMPEGATRRRRHLPHLLRESQFRKTLERIREKQARPTAALQNFIRWARSSSGPRRVRFFIGCAAAALRDPAAPRLETFRESCPATSKAAPKAIHDHLWCNEL